MAEVSVLHNSQQPGSSAASTHPPQLRDDRQRGFAVHDDYFTDDGVAQAMAMADSDVTDVSAIVWQQAGSHLTVRPSVPLTEGQACAWSFIPTWAALLRRT